MTLSAKRLQIPLTLILLVSFLTACNSSGTGGGGVTTPLFFMPYRASIDLVQSSDFGVDLQLTGQPTRGEVMVHEGVYDAALREVDNLLPEAVVYVEDGRILKKGLRSPEDLPTQVSSAIDVRQCPEFGEPRINTLVTNFSDADAALYLYEGPGPDEDCLNVDDNRVRMVRLSDDVSSGLPAIVPNLDPEATFFDLANGTLTGILAVNEQLLLPVPVRRLNLYDADYANPVLVRNFLNGVRSLTQTADAAFLVVDDTQLIRVNPDASQVLVYPVPDGAQVVQAETDGDTLFFLQSADDGLTLFSLPLEDTNTSPPTIPRTLFSDPLASVEPGETPMYLTTNRVVLNVLEPGFDTLISLDKFTATESTLESVPTDNGGSIDRVGTTGAFVFYNVSDGTDVAARFAGEGGAILDSFARSAWAGFMTASNAVPAGLPAIPVSHLLLAAGYTGPLDSSGLSGAGITTYRVADRATELVGTLGAGETDLAIRAIGPVALGEIDIASGGLEDTTTVFALDAVLSRFQRITDSSEGDARPVPPALFLPGGGVSFPD